MKIAIEELTGQGLISEKLFIRLTNRIAKEQNMPHEFAARIVDQALAFLRACGENRAAALAPSELVDIDWHTFILYTREYAEFCERVAGRFIHHVPNDDRKGDSEPEDAVARTKEAIRALGVSLDGDMWLPMSLKCSSGDDGCRASGGDGNENTESNGK